MTLSLARLGLMGGIASGDLKLIETQTVSDAVANLSFDSIQETTYADHFVTFQDFLPESDNRHLALRFKVGGTTTTGNDYAAAMQRQVVATPNELLQGNDTKIWLAYNVGQSRERCNGYIYIHNAGSSSKYTGMTAHVTFINKDANYTTNYLSGVRKVASTVNGIEFATSGGNISSGTFSLYGIEAS